MYMIMPVRKERLSFISDSFLLLSLSSLSHILAEFLLGSSTFHGIQGTLLPPRVGVRWSEACWSGGLMVVCVCEGGFGLSTQEGRRLVRPLHSDSLPEYTQISEEATGKKRRRKGSKRAKEGNSGQESFNFGS